MLFTSTIVAMPRSFETCLIEGFAVLTSDAGHAPGSASYPNDPATGLGIAGQVFGLDPQARKDYGYAAVGSLTPMAKSLIAAAYGRGPDRICHDDGRFHLIECRSQQSVAFGGARPPELRLPRGLFALQSCNPGHLMNLSTSQADAQPRL
jgi:feruloyl esterase